MKSFVILVVGIVVGYLLARVKSGESLRERQTEEKKRNKRVVMEMFKTETQVTNDQVQSLLSVSDSTATRYLDELEKEGKITQHGTTGHEVYYTLR